MDRRMCRRCFGFVLRPIAWMISGEACDDEPLQKVLALTCWLIKTTAMSFRSWVKLWKARSISEVSVFESTTRKFRCASGGSVTCCRKGDKISMRAIIDETSIYEAEESHSPEDVHTPMPARRRPVTELKMARNGERICRKHRSEV